MERKGKVRRDNEELKRYEKEKELRRSEDVLVLCVKHRRYAITPHFTSGEDFLSPNHQMSRKERKKELCSRFYNCKYNAPDHYYLIGLSSNKVSEGMSRPSGFTAEALEDRTESGKARRHQDNKHWQQRANEPVGTCPGLVSLRFPKVLLPEAVVYQDASLLSLTSGCSLSVVALFWTICNLVNEVIIKGFDSQGHPAGGLPAPTHDARQAHPFTLHRPCALPLIRPRPPDPLEKRDGVVLGRFVISRTASLIYFTFGGCFAADPREWLNEGTRATVAQWSSFNQRMGALLLSPPAVVLLTLSHRNRQKERQRLGGGVNVRAREYTEACTVFNCVSPEHISVQTERDGETVTGPPEHVETDDEKSSLNSVPDLHRDDAVATTVSTGLQHQSALYVSGLVSSWSCRPHLPDSDQEEGQAELEAAQEEARSVSTELFNVKNSNKEALVQLEAVKRENKNLQCKAHQARSSHGFLDTCDHEESEILCVHIQLNTEVKREADRKLAERDEEVEQIRRTRQRRIDSMLSILNSVVRSRNNAVWIKKTTGREKRMARKYNSAEPIDRLLRPRNKLGVGDVYRQTVIIDKLLPVAGECKSPQTLGNNVRMDERSSQNHSSRRMLSVSKHDSVPVYLTPESNGETLTARQAGTERLMVLKSHMHGEREKNLEGFEDLIEEGGIKDKGNGRIEGGGRRGREEG
ncbi:Myosin heavy chain, fast skeletal muscle [Liparis tanakae]|uniref:Myosin heavy chain, fast skeletal muscle n=1 Tax=Liparis tanakae TaxID=230148 RepID=A0A4Z2IPJ6_9TELE|nr:Myosin heavy chain, fast skeletal muscle [Liparis tanakae]